MLVANNPFDLVCMDFTKMNPSKDDKENVLLMTDAFSKSIAAMVTPNRKTHTVAKMLVDKWFYTCGIPFQINSGKVTVLRWISSDICVRYTAGI